MINKTIVYCSSNRESPEFEQRIRDNIIKNCGDIPIICVSQKPIANFGRNIVVGDVGASGFNFFRQTQLALKELDCQFVISAEADCLYPPDYFQFTPPRLDVPYRNSNLYVMGDHRDYYWHKPEGATHAQIVGTQFYLDTLNKLFEGAPQWSVEEKNFPKERNGKNDVFDKVEMWRGDNPVIQIKTRKGMRHYTHSERIPIYNLDYWGTVNNSEKPMSKISDAITNLHGPGVVIPECNRFDLPDYFVEKGYKVGAEIGVEMGRYTKHFCIKPLQIYAIDPWFEYEDFSTPTMLNQTRINKTYNYAMQNLKRFPNCTVVRKTSMEAAKDFKDGSLDFVFIDGHHGFKYVAEDLWEWSKKVHVGGIIAGHDYTYIDKPTRDAFSIHVGYVVDAFTKCFKINDWYRLSKIEGDKRDRYDSYFWVNPQI